VKGTRLASGRKNRWLLWFLGALAVLLIALGIAVNISLHHAEPMLREVIVEKLQERFHARVELDSFHMSLVNGLWAEGKGLQIWPPAEVEGVTVPGTAPDPNQGGPLIRIAEFRFHAPLRFDPGKPVHISVVQLQGLDIDMPPKSHFTHAEQPQQQPASGREKKKPSNSLLHFQIDTIECTGANLTLETSKPGKMPLVFAIQQLKLANVSAGGAMHFDAVLTIPRPAGLIQTSGMVGPWSTGDPGETPVSGDYQFSHADLGVFKGIAGILDSTGKYSGPLRNMEVEGETTTPDFRLTHFGTALPLKTTFHATVDGTNGDTYLHPVDAMLGRSHFTAEGEIVRVRPVLAHDQVVKPGGHDISLKVNVDRGKMDDFLRLTSKNDTPLLTGDLVLKTTLDIPPGKEPVHERIRLNGNFTLTNAEFTSAKIQNYVGQLSLRGQGDTKEAKNGGGADTKSAMQGNFKMGNGVIDLPNLQYSVPGAQIDLAGKYGLQGSTLDFAGTARTDATVSQMVGGWKGFLLKPADRIFKKDGAGTLVPIHVNGTREDPKFGVDFKDLKHTHPATPGENQQ